jgi:phosphoglycolate phosphatase
MGQLGILLPMTDKKLLLLDFDGVIADTFPIAHAVAQRTCVYLTEREYRRTFNGNVYDAQAMRNASDHGDRCDHLLDWWAAYRPGFDLHARPFKDMPEILEQFAQSYMLCIVSSTRDHFLHEFLEKFDLTRYIDGIYGADIDTHKDKKFRTIFSKYGIAPDATVFITDTLGDVNEATSVGLKSIGVTWGFQDKETLARGDPFRIVELPPELPNAVEEYFREVQA